MAKKTRRFGRVEQDAGAAVEIGGSGSAETSTGQPDQPPVKGPVICDTCSTRVGSPIAALEDPRGVHECSRCRSKLLPGGRDKVVKLDAERKAKRAQKP